MTASSTSIASKISTHTKELNEIIESAIKHELVIVIGAGVSVSLSNGALPNWTHLIDDGLNYCKRKGFIDQAKYDRWSEHLSSNDLDEILSAAEFMSRKIGAPKGDLYGKWLRERFRNIGIENTEMLSAIKTLSGAAIPICTLNYDSMLEKATGLPSIIMTDKVGVSEWMRRERQGILHLHGLWNNPETCILSIRDYQTTIGNEIRDLTQRALGAFKRLLFIGCGATFADPNFSALVSWLRENLGAASLQHYALVRTSEVSQYNKDVTWHGFVEPLSFGNEYAELAPFIKKNFSLIFRNSLSENSNQSHNSDDDAEVLEAYRRFILKDCGQMAIEGIRADMDTAKQKFDIENLFVPLHVSPCPPEFSSNDPDKNEKLSAWLRENNVPRPFGTIFKETKNIALLALPGGGKTMLLKRLAVAYAEPERRARTSDLLPEIDIYPVLIRCREWRDHIRSPILTLLKNLNDITGQSNLSGLSNALIPLLQMGKVLLLVDGLDEIHNNSDRSTFVEHLESFLEDYPNIRFVVTSREAGFSLVAPSLSRFCTKFQVAPLNLEAISLLCHHWHILMTGDSSESISEAEHLAKYLIENGALRRLAENPLLLTMLLVVKHGAGRLPPDRVSLYSRAVEVLLDTWNIKGHEALNLKEAIPQLACVAFQMMRDGKQTATENELLTLLEEARRQIPHIGRYAKDSAYEFLKRVELRSSLLLEAGHQIEHGQPVPFYQFRHLTFQEYLAAVAAAEGYFLGYKSRDTVLSPLRSFLLAEEWKEVVPMTAVIAGKQSGPLAQALVDQGKKLETKLLAGKNFLGKDEWMNHPPKLPPPIARLTQCLIEEAEVPQEVLTDALKLVALFARGCRSNDDWKSLARGPYGAELIHQAWQLYDKQDTYQEGWVRNTCSNLGAKRQLDSYWSTSQGKAELRNSAESDSIEEISMALLTCTGAQLHNDKKFSFLIPREIVEKNLFHESPTVWHAAAWLWALSQRRSAKKWIPTTKILDQLLKLWTLERNLDQKIIGFAFSSTIGHSRKIWKPKLNEEQTGYLLADLSKEIADTGLVDYEVAGACIIAFHAGGIVPDKNIAEILKETHIGRQKTARTNALLRQLDNAKDE